MRACDGYQANNISASTGTFYLSGGLYAYVVVSGTTMDSSDHMDLTSVAPDGSTVITWITGPNGTKTNPQTAYLPPGTYSLTLTGTLSGIYANLCRIPFD